MEQKINLTQNVINQIQTLILSYKKPEKIIIFGSRVTKGATRVSDIDVAIFAKKWSSKDFNLVHHLLEEKVKTVLKIDVIDYYHVKEPLQKNINRGVIIYDQQNS